MSRGLNKKSNISQYFLLERERNLHYFYKYTIKKEHQMPVVTTDRNSILLNTGLNETAFSKVANGLNFMEEGLIVRFNLFENNFQFAPWSFSGTTVIDDTVYFEGEAFNANTAWSVMNSDDGTKKIHLCYALNKIFSKVVESSIKLPCNGLGGILFNEKLSKKNSSIYQVELLFLPENLYDYFASNADEKEYSYNQELWQNKALTSSNAHIFTQSVINYYVLTGIFPFLKTNTQERQEDIKYSNFIKIENLVDSIDENLAANINMGFNIDNKYERDACLIDIPLLKEELGLLDDGTVKPKERKQISKDAFEKRINRKQKSISRKANTKKFLKRNVSIIVVVILLSLLGLNLGIKKYTDDLEKPSAENLTAIQTIEMFFTGFHEQNSEMMRIVSKGSDASDFIDMISDVYVSSTLRTAYEGKGTSLSPEVYFSRPELNEYYVFGITHFQIDEIRSNNRFSPNTRAEVKLLKQKGLILPEPENKTETHKVSYYQVIKQGPELPFEIEKVNCTVKCEYIKKQWYITEISDSYSYMDFNESEFTEDYENISKDYDNMTDTIRVLREKYEWLPDDLAMLEAIVIVESQKNFQVEY